MADRLFVRWIYDIPEYMAYIFRYYWTLQLNETPSMSGFSYGVYQGFRYAEFSYEQGPDTWTERYVFAQLAAGEFVPVRALLKLNGMATLITTGFGPENPGGYTFDFTADAWELYFVEKRKEFVDQMTYGSCGDTVYQSITAAGGNLASRVALTPVFSDSEVFGWIDKLNGVKYEPGPAVSVVFFDATVTEGVANVPVQNIEGAISRVAQGLSDIAHKTTVTTLNNQGAIAVLDSAEILTPGGGG